MRPAASPATRPATATGLALGLAAALAACADDDLPPDPVPAPAHCVQPADRLDRIVRVSGSIIDFTTQAPVAGAVVDITTAWDTEGDIPAADCPSLATVTTDAAGRFGPISVYAGTGLNLPIMLFRVAGADRALTVSDNRACASSDTDACGLDHTIAAPTAAQAAAWRAELAAGGMADAAHRGLIAFLFKNSDGTPAAEVQPTVDSLIAPRLRPGADVRFVDVGRAGLTPVSDTSTSAAGVAVAGIEPRQLSWPGAGTARIGGDRGVERWAHVGSLILPDAIFVEDKTVSPTP